jgi:hypothetical protein
VRCRSLVQKVAHRGEMKQIRSQAPGSAFDRTWCVRTQLRSNVVTHVRTQVQSARVSRVALAGPIVHRFNLAPWAVICVQPHIGHSNAHVVKRSAYTRTHAAL